MSKNQHPTRRESGENFTLDDLDGARVVIEDSEGNTYKSEPLDLNCESEQENEKVDE